MEERRVGEKDPTSEHPGDEEPGKDEGELADIDLEYRGRGRPRLPLELRRREKLVVSLTKDELRRVMVRAANDATGPLSPQDWVRREILALAPREDD